MDAGSEICAADGMEGTPELLQASDDEFKQSLDLDKAIVEEIERTQELQNQYVELQEAIAIVRDSGWEAAPAFVEKLKTSVEHKEETLRVRREEWSKDLGSDTQHPQASPSASDSELEHLAARIRLKREEQASLEQELERMLPKQASRSSYIHRITELAKSSRKQDLEMLKIMEETRELQRESNTTQERLHRTHALLEELLFREAKKDATCRIAYQHLDTMHESFASLASRVLEIDKLEQDIADLEAKLGNSNCDLFKLEDVVVSEGGRMRSPLL